MNNETKDKQSVEYIDYVYIVNEMIQEMESTLANLNNVFEKQSKVLAFLLTVNNEGILDDLIKAAKNTLKQYETQQYVLAHRIECAKLAIDKLSNETSYTISMLLEGIGIANKEAKSLIDRLNNNEDSKIN